MDVVGTDAEAIAQTIVREGFVSSLQHAAYLGHELHKAEVALKLRLNFVQDSELDFSKKTMKKEQMRQLKRLGFGRGDEVRKRRQEKKQGRK